MKLKINSGGVDKKIHFVSNGTVELLLGLLIPFVQKNKLKVSSFILLISDSVLLEAMFIISSSSVPVSSLKSQTSDFQILSHTDVCSRD